MSENKKYFNLPVIIIISTILILFIISLIPPDTEILGYQVKGFNLFSDFSDLSEESGELLTPAAESYSQVLKAGIFSDIIDLSNLANENYITAKGIDDLIKYEKITGNTDQLKYFFEALKKVDNTLVRIAHLGDSIIEGDLVSAEMRDRLQAKFGGSGVGYQALTSADTQFRVTTEHEFSDDWTAYSLFGKKSRKYEYSLNGEIFIPANGSTVNYKMRDAYKRSSTFENIRVLYYEKDNSKISLTFDNKTEDLKLTPSPGLSEIVKSTGGNISEVGLKFFPSNSTNIVGVYLEPAKGIELDNYPFRGNTGDALTELSTEKVAALNKLLDYKLVILQFGLNAVSMRKSDFPKYKKELTKGIKNLKEALPETSIVLMGVSDKSKKKGSSFVTDPQVKELIKLQQEVVAETGIAFWNTFEAMGGENSMPKWVKSKPSYASSDFTHFNKSGADKIGEIFSKVLIDGYIEYSK